MVKSLQSIRFVFALMIFLHHTIAPVSTLGAFGVSFFLILSGFVLMYGNKGRIENKEQKLKFFLKRVKKIYPLHILCLILAVLISTLIGESLEWTHLAPNAFLIHSWIPQSSYYFSGNSLSWYLSVMVFCYAMFPLLVGWMRKWGGVFLVLLLTFYPIAVAIVPDAYVGGLIYINPLFRIVDFCLGMWLAHVCTNDSMANMMCRLKNMSVSKKTIIEVMLALLSLALIVLSEKTITRFNFASFWWMPSMLIIFILFTFDNNGGGITRLLNKTISVTLGSVSFAFYMLHILVLRVNDYLMNNVISMNYYLNGVLVVLVTIGLSYLITYCYMPLFTQTKRYKK